MKMKLPTIILLLLFGVLADQAAQKTGKEDVTCSAPSVEKGQMMNITCDFKEDMMKVKTRQGFVIQYYKDDTFSQSVEILDCYWTDSYQCTVYDERFIHDPHISRYVTVSLPHADERAEGLYVCQEIGILDDDPKACQFKLKESKGAQTKAVASLEESTEGPSDDETDTTKIWVWCLVSVAIGVVLVTMVVFYRRRTRSRRNKKIFKVEEDTKLRDKADRPLNDPQPEEEKRESTSSVKTSSDIDLGHTTRTGQSTGIHRNPQFDRNRRNPAYLEAQLGGKNL